MKRHLRDELKQARPFPTLEEEVCVEIQRTSQAVSRWVALALRPWTLSESQFNVLRILRGSGEGGLPAARIVERMVRHDPDLTRLLDRLEAAGLAEKARDARDRRVVNARITETGLRVVESASEAVSRSVVKGLRHLGVRRLEALADLLELARTGGDFTDSPTPTSGSGTRPARAPRPRRSGRNIK
jgi:DNA-binding MarR family transcriptional regulator